jgi:branched-chain amino acid transport system permease protein
LKDIRNLCIALCLVVLLACLPLMLKSEYFVTQLIMLFIYVSLSQSWNLLGGFSGQISLGHAALFGMGVLVTRMLWVANVPIVLASLGGGVASMLLAGVVGIPCLRMKKGYFPIGTLALAIIAQITVGNILPLPSYLPNEHMTGYTLSSRYYLALCVAIVNILIVYYTVRSRTGLALVAIRDDQGAAEAMGVKTLRYKILALLLSGFLAGLTGSVYAFHQVSFYYQSAFELSWSFLPTLTTFIGGVGTIIGPIVGSLFFLVLNELFALTLGEVHLIIFGLCFVLIILFLPGGLMSLSRRIQIPVFKLIAGRK